MHSDSARREGRGLPSGLGPGERTGAPWAGKTDPMSGAKRIRGWGLHKNRRPSQLNSVQKLGECIPLDLSSPPQGPQLLA